MAFLEKISSSLKAIFTIFILGIIIYIIITIIRKSTCSYSKKVTEPCEKNCDCDNEACGRETANDNEPLTCCKSGETTLYAGFDYCTNMPDESTCWSNVMCASGFCRDNGGGTRKGKCGKGNIGDDCGINNDCKNGACGRETADGNAPLTCCKSGDTTMFGGFDYCTNMPDESTCWSNAMCAGGYCRDNGGGTRKGKCGKGNVGNECGINSDCKNNACGRESADTGTPLTCCKSGDTTMFGGFDYCTNMPDENVCWSNAMCASGYCRDNGGGTRKGLCGKANIGEFCGVNNDCKNNACGRETADSGAPLTCCKSGDTTTFGGFDYCTNMPDGSTCWSDFMCQSKLCEDNGGGIRKGKCKSKKDIGESCSSNNDCKNNACGRATAADGTPLTCCRSSEIRTYAGFDYCGNMPNGSVCWSDAMCASDNCKGNMYG